MEPSHAANFMLDTNSLRHENYYYWREIPVVCLLENTRQPREQVETEHVNLLNWALCHIRLSCGHFSNYKTTSAPQRLILPITSKQEEEAGVFYYGRPDNRRPPVLCFSPLKSQPKKRHKSQIYETLREWKSCIVQLKIQPGIFFNIY